MEIEISISQDEFFSLLESQNSGIIYYLDDLDKTMLGVPPLKIIQILKWYKPTEWFYHLMGEITRLQNFNSEEVFEYLTELYHLGELNVYKVKSESQEWVDFLEGLGKYILMSHKLVSSKFIGVLKNSDTEYILNIYRSFATEIVVYENSHFIFETKALAKKVRKKIKENEKELEDKYFKEICSLIENMGYAYEKDSVDIFSQRVRLISKSGYTCDCFYNHNNNSNFFIDQYMELCERVQQNLIVNQSDVYWINEDGKKVREYIF